ncbi:hypothetical protein EYC84_003638 [Monilinia fructicola]|uniref:Uncharacterized protein n=1 Tax=Monilinia fructicola TaxID=38448 RepID=A0A5M9JUC1_MONFR|nr:hypothetical protein EYC84_003638 [Monilinia fructicola]
MASTGALIPMPMPVATSGTLEPTWQGPELIKSGNIFIHEANSSGVKRWTDGITWSPSRMVGNFLVYRELNKPLHQERKREPLRKTRTRHPKERGGGANQSRVYSSVHGALSKDLERSLVGSLVDSYDFKEDDICLIKKTITIKHPPDDPNVLNEDDDVRENHSSFQNNSGRGDYNFANRNAPRLPAPSMNNMPYQSNNFFANNHYAMGVGPTSYNLSSYNGSLPAVTSGASSYNTNLSGAIPNTVSPYNGAIPATSSNGGSYAQYAQVPGMYDQKPETYGNVYRQRHNSNPSMNTTPLGHRPSGYGQQSLGSGVPEVVSGMSGMLQGQMGSRNPHETGIPGMFQGQMGSRNLNETGYTSGSIYQSRDSPNTPHGYSQTQRALPASNQPYNPQATNQYNQHMEASPGNASAGHAHYMMNTQANWPSPNGV